MTYRLRIRREAERDLDRLYVWYESQAAGLGQRLKVELESTFSSLQEMPLIYADIYRGTRRAILRRYPVGVFYKIVDETVHVVAVDHLARNPAIWRRRN
jgi:plasmid stabilization system protein ParE